MATVYSDQQTLKRAIEAGTGYSLQNGFNTDNARVHVKYASYTTTAIASGTVIELFTLPKNARILRGVLITGAMGTNVTTSIGTDVSLKNDAGTETTAAGVANCLAATATASASNTNFCVTRLLGAGALTSAVTTFNAVTGGATADAGILVHAWVEYLQN